MLLPKITSQGNWEVSEKNIQTVGGAFIGVATTPENALGMAIGPKLLRLIETKLKDNKEIQTEVEQIINTARG